MPKSMVDVMKYFEIPPTQFRKEWAELTEAEKLWFKTELEKL